MTTYRDPDADERDWQLQERAMRAEREGLSIADTEPDLAAYRLLAMALRKPASCELPTGFADSIAARIECLEAAMSDRLEAWLQRCLIAVLVLSAAIAVPIIGRAWTAIFDSSTSTSWILATLACVGFSVLFQRFAWAPRQLRA